jgi:hypothetical protein
MPPTFPGAYTFIRQVADEQQDSVLGTRIAQLAPVNRALNWIGLIASPKSDERSRQDLMKRIESEIRDLQGGITAIQRGLAYLEEHHDTGSYTPAGHPGLRAALAPRVQATRPAQSGYPGIVSAPIDPGMLGATPTAERRTQQNIEMQERYRKIGIDEGMSGGPPRPDTGINQSLNQQNIPTGPEVSGETAMSAATYKQNNNPPYEPSNSDDGAGAMLASEEGSPGRVASGMVGHVGTVRDAGQPTTGARGSDSARQTVERLSAPDRPGRPPQMATIPTGPEPPAAEAPEPVTMKQQVEAAADAEAETNPPETNPPERQQRKKK